MRVLCPWPAGGFISRGALKSFNGRGLCCCAAGATEHAASDLITQGVERANAEEHVVQVRRWRNTFRFMRASPFIIYAAGVCRGPWFIMGITG